MATFDEFQKIKMQVGRIVSVEDFPRARQPSYKIEVDFGPGTGIKRTSAQATSYPKESLVGLDVIAVTNFPPKNIAGFMSEVLILGVEGEDGRLSLLVPDREAKPGARVH
jgi:tRNA-binding protein